MTTIQSLVLSLLLPIRASGCRKLAAGYVACWARSRATCSTNRAAIILSEQGSFKGLGGGGGGVISLKGYDITRVQQRVLSTQTRVSGVQYTLLSSELVKQF